MAKRKNLSPKYQVWIDARRRIHLSDAQIQMARELGMSPKKFEKRANHKQEPWLLPLGQFIQDLYFKHFHKTRPDNVRSIEQMVADRKSKKLGHKKTKTEGQQSSPADDAQKYEF